VRHDRPNALPGSHLAVAVESSLQDAKALTPTRFSTTNTPANHSSCAFAVSPTPDLSSTAAPPAFPPAAPARRGQPTSTIPAPRRPLSSSPFDPVELCNLPIGPFKHHTSFPTRAGDLYPPPLGLAVGSHHRAPIPPINPLESFPSACSCSPASQHRRIPTGAPLPTSAARHRLLLAVEHPSPALSDPNWLHTKLPHIALKLPDLFLTTPDHRSTVPAVHLHHWPHCPRRAAATSHPDPIPTTPRGAPTW
jgi:hypothetical protein